MSNARNVEMKPLSLFKARDVVEPVGLLNVVSNVVCKSVGVGAGA